MGGFLSVSLGVAAVDEWLNCLYNNVAMEYEWDEEKSETNIAADRLGFEAIEDF